MEKGPLGQRRGRGARERILDAAQHLFREHGINNTGMDQLCAEAGVSKRTVYQHFGSKEQLIAAYLRELDAATQPEAFSRGDLTPREQLLAVFDVDSADGPTPLCPFIGAAVELDDPTHPARVIAADYKRTMAEHLTGIAREAGAGDPEQLGEQLALLLDGASARNRATGRETFPTAAVIAEALIDAAVPVRKRTASRRRTART